LQAIRVPIAPSGLTSHTVVCTLSSASTSSPVTSQPPAPSGHDAFHSGRREGGFSDQNGPAVAVLASFTSVMLMCVVGKRVPLGQASFVQSTPAAEVPASRVALVLAAVGGW